MKESIIKGCNEAQLRYLTKVIESKLEKELQNEWLNYNQFLEEANISVLPDNYYKNGKPLDYGEVRRLYSEWENKRK